MPPTIAVDAHGADRGVNELIAGVKVAAQSGVRVLLFGRAVDLGDALEIPGVEVIDAPDVITNHEEPAVAVREKPRASVVMTAKALADGSADAMVSAGPTGATFAAGLFNAKRINGVRRPALAAVMPVGRTGRTIFLDAGANVDATSEMLTQFAVMGSVFAAQVTGVERPSVGLLSVGEEPEKGNAAVTGAHELLARSDLNFIGNIEGRDIPFGRVDVIVTDGFTGNVAIKTLEGTAKFVTGEISSTLRKSLRGKLGGLLIRPKLAPMRHEFDPNSTGGALLLGLRKVVVVAHGSSTSTGIASAIALAAKAVERDYVAVLERELAALSELAPASVSVDNVNGE